MSDDVFPIGRFSRDDTQRVLDEIYAGWKPFTPTVTGGGSMTISSLVVEHALTWKLRRTVFLLLNLTFTTGGSADTTVNITNLPYLASLTNQNISTEVISDSSVFSPGSGIFTTSTNLRVRNKDAANWTLTTSRRITISGFYMSDK